MYLSAALFQIQTQLYILDAWQNVCPVGVAGELYIGGEGVARGYVNLPALTGREIYKRLLTEKNPEGKLYKTGDLVRWLPGLELWSVLAVRTNK